MRCLVVFTALLLAAQFDQGVSIKISVLDDDSVSLTTEVPNTNVIECLATHNNVLYSIYPHINLTNAAYEGYSDNCNFRFYPANFNHSGIWTVKKSWKDKDEKVAYNFTQYEVHVIENLSPLPETHFTTDEGNYVTVFTPDTFTNFTDCILVHDHNQTVTETFDLLNPTEINVNMELVRKCGVRFLINEKRYGKWTLVQKFGPYNSRNYQFYVLNAGKHNGLIEINISWRRGSPAKIEQYDISRIQYCMITRPDGKTIVLQDHTCTYDIPEVSNVHAGVWILKYSIREKMNLLEKRYNVHVYDTDFVNVTVDTSNTQKIHLMCKIAQRTLQSCLFTKPDGDIINLSPGVGDAKYEYYGNGYRVSSEGYGECGLTVYNPSYEDFGLWKCSLRVDGQTISTFVPTFAVHEIDLTKTYTSNHTYVKHGDNLMVKCATSAPLEYCWLRDPNGTIYTVANSQTSINNTLPYVGEGLAVGVCGAKVKNASNAHVGNWSCRLGIVQGGEMEILVPVTVTESYLYPNRSIVYINDDENRTLMCNILPEKEAIVKYCRWIRPDGYGIHRENSVQYFTSHEHRSCILQIKENNPKNIGRWTCYARLTDNLNDEVFASIYVTTENKESFSFMSILLHATAAGLVTIILACSCIVVILLYRKKLRNKKLQIRECSIGYEIHENEVKHSNEKIPKI